MSTLPSSTGSSGSTGGASSGDPLTDLLNSLFGVPGQVAIAQLQNVKYQIAVYYMGPERVARDNNYRCRHELKVSDMLIIAGPSMIPNVVGASDPLLGETASDRAAKPLAQGGTNEDPTSDLLYKVMITDNHGLKSADFNLLGPAGDNHSRPSKYRGANWDRDIFPCVAMRVVIRRFVGLAPDDVPSDLKLVVEIKDPAEQLHVAGLSQADDFLAAFFASHNHNNADPTAGGDNAQTDFNGVRPASGQQGVKATDVLRSVSYASPPVADEFPMPPTSPATVSFGSLGSVTAHQSTLAKFDVQPQTMAGVQVGVVDFVFRPPPIGGDNYRFLFTLTDSGGTDIRDTQANGTNVELLDEVLLPIPKPRSYCTGKFEIWRKIPFKMLLLVNNVAASSVDWATIANFYRPAFCEIVPPDPGNVISLRRETWRDLMRARFRGRAGINQTNLNHENEFDDGMYSMSFFPMVCQPNPQPDGSFTQAQSNQWTDDLLVLCRQMVNSACTNASPAITPPQNDAVQDDGDGFFMVATLDYTPNSSLMGMYLGDRIFCMKYNQVAARELTDTLIHELGHGLFLRHGYTNSASGNDLSAPSTKIIRVYNPQENCAPFDHDSHQFACLMSYVDATTYSFCGVCLLGLRHYDRKAITSNSQYRSRIMERLTSECSLMFVRARASPPAFDCQVRPSGSTITVLRNTTARFIAVGPEESYTHLYSNEARFMRVNQSRFSGSSWSFAGPVGTLTTEGGGSLARIRTGNTSGTGTLTFRNTTLNVNCSITIEVP